MASIDLTKNSNNIKLKVTDLDIDGERYLQVVIASGLTITTSGGSTGGNMMVGGADVSNANPLPVSDAGGSLTIDGTVTIVDGTGSITVDGTITANPTQIPTSGVYCGHIVVTASGTAVQGTDVANPAGFYIKAHPDNADTTWVGNDGTNDVSPYNGYPLDPGEQVLFTVANLNQLWFDADSNAEIICWHRA